MTKEGAVYILLLVNMTKEGAVYILLLVNMTKEGAYHLATRVRYPTTLYSFVATFEVDVLLPVGKVPYSATCKLKINR